MSKAKNLGAGMSFTQARPISARRAAIGAATEAPTDGVPDPTELPLGLISQNPDNPRDELRELDGLTDSIREIGLVNAITIATVDAYLAERPDRAADLDEGTRYVVIDGHRRLEASRRAGSPTIRVSVDNSLVSTDESLLEAAFVANVHRDDMNPLEQAHALRKLVDFYGSQNKAAKRLGIAQSTISSKLSVLDLDPQLQADLVTGRRKIEHVRNLSKLDPEQQRQEADERAATSSRRRSTTTHLSRRDNSDPAPPDDPAPATDQQQVTQPSLQGNDQESDSDKSSDSRTRTLPVPRKNDSPPSADKPQADAAAAPRRLPYDDGEYIALHLIMKMEEGPEFDKMVHLLVKEQHKRQAAAEAAGAEQGSVT